MEDVECSRKTGSFDDEPAESRPSTNTQFSAFLMQNSQVLHQPRNGKNRGASQCVTLMHISQVDVATA